MAYEYQKDIFFTSEGDFVLGSNKDLKTTELDVYRGLIQRINKRIMSTHGDWPLQDSLGATLGDFVGMPNTRETGALLKSRISSELSRDSLLSAKDVQVNVFPISNTQILISIAVSLHSFNGFVNLQYTYDMRDNKLTPRNL